MSLWGQVLNFYRWMLTNTTDVDIFTSHFLLLRTSDPFEFGRLSGVASWKFPHQVRGMFGDGFILPMLR